VRDEFERVMGRVSRIDFTCINKKPGFGENVDDVVKSAFVHFDSLYDNLKTTGLLINFKNNMSYRFHPTAIDEYWILLKAKNPIPDTLMNNAQIVENCRYLEKKVQDQDETIKKLEEKLEAVHQVVYQLVGGLFNHATQARILDEHVNMMFPNARYHCDKELEDTHKWTHWPTTRQGDECERRIEALEQQIQSMTNFDPESVYNFIADDEEQDSQLLERKMDRSASTMPELVDGEDEEDEDYSVSTHSSMPSLISCSSSDSQERIRNSYELCGNN
jgi:hypothetical protein